MTLAPLSGEAKLEAVVCDDQTVREALGQTRDGVRLCVQPGVAEEAFTSADLLLSATRYYPQTLQLSDPLEVAVPKTATFAQLREALAAGAATMAPTTEEVSSTEQRRVMLLGEQGSQTAEAHALDEMAPDELAGARAVAPEPAALVVAKAMSWQLRDVANLTHIKWEPQPEDDSVITEKPWRLPQAANVVFKVVTERELLRVTEEERTAAATAAAAAASSGPETGFRIFTPEERRLRKAEREADAAERKKQLEERMGADAARLCADPNAPAPAPAPAGGLPPVPDSVPRHE